MGVRQAKPGAGGNAAGVFLVVGVFGMGTM
jgi:hypothetical protein